MPVGAVRTAPEPASDGGVLLFGKLLEEHPLHVSVHASDSRALLVPGRQAFFAGIAAAVVPHGPGVPVFFRLPVENVAWQKSANFIAGAVAGVPDGAVPAYRPVHEKTGN